MFVYMIINDVNGKYYIGKTVCKTLREYMRTQIQEARRGETDKPYLYNAIRKYGEQAFRIEPLMSTLRTDAELKHWERFLIALMCPAYNLSEGGDGVTMTPEIRKKISEKAKVRVYSEETRRKFSEARRGKKRSPETCAKMSAARKGIPMSAETKKKLSDFRKSFTGWKHSAETRAKMTESLKKRHARNKLLQRG